MEGTIWLDTSKTEWPEIEGHLTHSVKSGTGSGTLGQRVHAMGNCAVAGYLELWPAAGPATDVAALRHSPNVS